MFPPIFPAVNASSAVKALLGSSPVRFYQFGLAPQNPTKPYVVWQRSSGGPENYINETPDLDTFTLLVDIYATSADSARAVATAVRDAIEPVSYITTWLGESQEFDTKLYRLSFLNDWKVPRT